jgi:hypothetical protein
MLNTDNTEGIRQREKGRKPQSYANHCHFLLSQLSVSFSPFQFSRVAFHLEVFVALSLAKSEHFAVIPDKGCAVTRINGSTTKPALLDTHPSERIVEHVRLTFLVRVNFLFEVDHFNDCFSKWSKMRRIRIRMRLIRMFTLDTLKRLIPDHLVQI